MNNLICNIIITFLLFNSFLLQAQNKEHYTLTGFVYDDQSYERLSFATIQLDSVGGRKASYGGITDINGNYYIKGVPRGRYMVRVSYIGYEQKKQSVSIEHSLTLSFPLSSSANVLDEVVVTASESKGMTSGSKIDRRAMELLQPTSFADLLELLPGGKSVDPNMGVANLIRIREARETTEKIASLGVQFMVDGIALNTDANLQYLPTYSKGANRESVGYGVDMRTLSTDNIESVEIVRGIPSVKYGNLTGGLVDIRRKQKETPLSIRFKADQTGKLFSFGKGISVLDNNILNLDLNFLDSKVDPRRSNENFKRITASARWNAKRKKRYGEFDWSTSVDYTGTADRIKRDKDVVLKEDQYQSDFNKLSIANSWHWRFNAERLCRQIYLKTSLSNEWSQIKERKSVSVDRPTGIPNNSVQGVSDGIYLPYNYLAEMVIDGKPFYAYAGMESDWGWKWGMSSHALKIGADWNLSKNFGEGQVYDTTRPLSPSLSLRPRAYHKLPALNQLAWYVEERATFPIALHKLTFAAGVRATSLLGLNKMYGMKGDVSFDPRIHMQWQLPALGANKDWYLLFNVGVGWMSRMPTLSQLYPDAKYVDIAQLNYYHTNSDFRKLNFITYQWDNTNYELQPARNRKWEVRFNVAHKGHDLSVTYFQEQMNNAFHTQTYYKIMPYTKYDESSVDPSGLTNPPHLDDFSSRKDTLINVYGMEGNATRVRKQGIELQYSSPRLSAIKTKFTITGAWYRTIYSSRMPWYEEASVLINNQQVQYIGLYDWEDGSVNERLTTNWIADTYLKRIGMTFSLSAQCTWFTARRQLWNDGIPVSYIDKSGTLRPYTEADKTHKQLKFLLKTYSKNAFERQTVPLALDLNLKATKNITDFIHLSLFVNRILHYYPTYKNGNVMIYRNSSPYFGMEANLTF